MQIIIIYNMRGGGAKNSEGILATQNALHFVVFEPTTAILILRIA